MEPRPLRFYEWSIGIALIIMLLFVVFFWRIASPNDTLSSGYVQPAPPGIPPPAHADYVNAQHGFDELIQITNTGPQPSALAVKRGDTVRFTNSASAPVRVAASTTSSNACVSGSFDSCSSIARGRYWEHTFTGAGTFVYTDGTGHTGVITVYEL